MEKIKNLPPLLFLLVGVGIAAMLYMQNLSDAEKMQNQLAQFNSKLTEEQGNLKKAQNSTQEITNLKTSIDKLSQTLSMSETLAPKTLSVRDILERISKEAKDAGIRVVSSKPKEISPKNFFDEIPIEVEFEGSYSQLTFYMYLLSKARLIFHLKNLDFSVKEIIGNQANLRLKAELVGFKYKEVTK